MLIKATNLFSFLCHVCSSLTTKNLLIGGDLISIHFCSECSILASTRVAMDTNVSTLIY
jgi:hypothetical protein